MKLLIKNTLLLAALPTLFLTPSCKKNESGGKAEIHARIYHGSAPVVGTTTLYVKFDAKSQPSDPVSAYDLKLTGDPDDNHVHVEGLRPGDYYLYAVAYDSTAMMQVKGGAAATIKWKERKKLKEIILQVD
jgi:hypothetical protein